MSFKWARCAKLDLWNISSVNSIHLARREAAILFVELKLFDPREAMRDACDTRDHAVDGHVSDIVQIEPHVRHKRHGCGWCRVGVVHQRIQIGRADAQRLGVFPCDALAHERSAQVSRDMLRRSRNCARCMRRSSHETCSSGLLESKRINICAIGFWCDQMFFSLSQCLWAFFFYIFFPLCFFFVRVCNGHRIVARTPTIWVAFG